MSGATLAEAETRTSAPPSSCSRRPDVAIFSAPKAFKGHIGLIQRNAIRSWLALGERAEVVLLGRDEGVAEIAAEFGIRHIPEIETNQFGTPLLNSMMSIAEANTTAPYLAMVNGDIVLTSDFFRFVDKLPALPKGLYIGLRSDLDVLTPIEFDDADWEKKLERRVRTVGRFRGDGDDSFNGTDYYIYPRGLYQKVPPFGIGRFFWDSWLIADVWRRGLRVVDASSEILAVHQNHDYGHVKSGASVDFYRYYENPELAENHRLAKGFLNGMGPREAPYRFRSGSIQRVPGRAMWKSQLYNFWYYYPIMLRGSWLFRNTPVGRSFGDIFPFDAPTGRHRFSPRNTVRLVARNTVRPAWKMLPAPVRTLAHKVVNVVRPPRAPPQAGPAPLRYESDGVDMAPVYAPVQRIFNAIAAPGERTMAPAWATKAITGAFSYGVLEARRRWSGGDLDMEHAIISRADLRRISPSALRALRDHFNEVYRDEHFLLYTRRGVPHRNLRVAEWPELLARAAEQDPEDTIVILNVWKRGPDLLRRQIKGLLEQTTPIKEIWICAFGVPDASSYEAVLLDFPGAPIHFFHSTKNLKYHGRFQLALQAEAEYIAFIDDDILIGPDFLRICHETLTKAPDAGEVGLYGWRRSPGPDADRRVDVYTKGEFIEHLPPERSLLGLEEADLLCGFHFLRQRHVRYLFREEPWTMSTGEDFQIAFALRKYLGLKSYVAPVDPADSATWALSEDWREIRVHATTVGDADAVRDTLYWKLLNRGHPAGWMTEAAARGETFILAAFSSDTEAHAARRAIEAAGSGMIQPLALYCGGAESATSSVMAFGLDPVDQVRHRATWFNLQLPASGLPRTEDAAAAFAALVRALKPVEFLAPAGDAGIVAAAQLACAGSATRIRLI
ncbi:MAG: glycosyltransferase family A protein [Pseudomonadota bacterium]